MSGRSMPPERTIETLHKHALRVKIIRKLKLQTPNVSAWFGLGSFGSLGFFIIVDSFVCLGQRFWSVTGCSASQAGSWLLYRCPRSYSPGHQANLVPVLWPCISIFTPRADLPIHTISSAAFVHFPQSTPGQQISLSSFTTATLVIASKALQPPLREGVKEHEQIGEGQMEIKDDHSNEDKFK